jgi:mannose-6-phosphate isomerase-like protein (cupin superfamily)
MENTSKYTSAEIGKLGSITRVTLRDMLGLTGAEISANCMAAGKESPFAHAHKRNEEIYLFTSGKGLFWLDGEIIPVQEGSVVRVSPSCFRYMKADDSESLAYFCIQVEENSLVQDTRADGIRSETRPSL